MDGLFEALKSETMDLHKEIEQWMPVFGSSFDRTAYARHLRDVLGFYRPVEREIHVYLGAHADPFGMPERYKVPKIEADLRTLGEVTAPEAVPEATAILPVRRLAELTGTLYVLEGSTLGGQLIKRHLKERLGLADGEMNFYRGYDAETGPMWKAFRQAAVDGLLQADQNATVERARQVFAAYMNWLKQKAQA